MTGSPLQATVTLRGVVLGADDDVPVVRRATDEGWELPGGRLGPHEDPVGGLRRELAEETGLEPAVHEPVHTLSWRDDADRGRFAVYYRCRCETRAVTLSAEHVEYEWVAPEAARDRLSDPQCRGVERATKADAATSSGRTGP